MTSLMRGHATRWTFLVQILLQLVRLLHLKILVLLVLVCLDSHRLAIRDSSQPVKQVRILRVNQGEATK